METTLSPHTPFADADPPRPARRSLLQIHLTPDERDLVRERAFDARMSQSKYVRIALGEYMRRADAERALTEHENAA